MRYFFALILGILAAFAIHSLLLHISISLTLVVNVLSVVVIYTGITKGEIPGAITGMACGLIQDSFSLGVFGVAGIAKTISGYLAGYISGKVNVAPYTRKFLLSSLLLFLELAVWSFLYVGIFSERINTGGGIIFFQPLITAAIVCFMFFILPKIKVKLAAKK